MSFDYTRLEKSELGLLRGKLVYIAGPYRSTNGRSVLENIRAAERVAIDLARAGVHFVCPHLNTAFMGGHGDHSGVVDDDAFWLEMMSRPLCPIWSRARWAMCRGLRSGNYTRW